MPSGREQSPCSRRDAADGRPYNRQCELTNLPFVDREFDLVIETAYAVDKADAIRAIQEIRRVSKGAWCSVVTTDLSIDLIERHNLLEGVRMLDLDGTGRKALCRRLRPCADGRLVA